MIDIIELELFTVNDYIAILICLILVIVMYVAGIAGAYFTAFIIDKFRLRLMGFYSYIVCITGATISVYCVSEFIANILDILQIIT